MQQQTPKTYEIISHQKLGFVIFSGVSVLFYQGLYVFISVHPLDCLFYLCLALEVAQVCIGDIISLIYQWFNVYWTMVVRMSHMFEGLSKAVHLEVISF